ncbi:replication protein A 70 kDa DNA-binding subunit B [Tanacetum coccineum]
MGNRNRMGDQLETTVNEYLTTIRDDSGSSGRQLECCFYEGWAEKFNDYANQNETTGPVVMILQLARVKYFNDKASVSNCLFSTKLYLNEDIPEIVAFKQRYLENDGEDEKNHAISLYSPMKKEVTIEEFFAGAIKKMVGSIRESGYEYEAIVYAKVHKIHRENGWTYTGCKRCGSKAKFIDSSESKPKTSAQSSSMTSGESSSFAAWHNTPKPKAPKQLWWCKRHELIEAVGPKYKVIVRVIDQTGSASLLLFDDMISKMVGVPCYKLKEQYGANAENTFPEELTNNIVNLA